MATLAGVAPLTAKKHFTTEDTEVTETRSKSKRPRGQNGRGGTLTFEMPRKGKGNLW
jgi:hypothetical protein